MMRDSCRAAFSAQGSGVGMRIAMSAHREWSQVRMERRRPMRVAVFRMPANPSVSANPRAMSEGSYAKRLKAAMGKQLIISAGVDAIVRNEDRDILLIRRSESGTWDLPGGAVEPGETPSE